MFFPFHFSVLLTALQFVSTYERWEKIGRNHEKKKKEIDMGRKRKSQKEKKEKKISEIKSGKILIGKPKCFIKRSAIGMYYLTNIDFEIIASY